MSTATLVAADAAAARLRHRGLRGILRSPRMSGSLVAGLIMLALVVLLSLFGPRLVNAHLAAVGA